MIPPRLKSVVIFTAACAGLYYLLVFQDLRNAVLSYTHSENAYTHPIISTLVGPRRKNGIYRPSSLCSSSEFLSAVANGYHDPSRLPSEISSPPQDISFVLGKQSPCAKTPLVIYNQADACDLLSSFGPIFLRGDSLLRHVQNALMLLLRGTPTGAVQDWNMEHPESCTGEALFDDGKRCRLEIVSDSAQAEGANTEPVCGSDDQVRVAFDNDFPHRRTNSVSDISKFKQLWKGNSRYSPILLHGHGLHDRLDPNVVTSRFLRPFWESLKKTEQDGANLPTPVHIYNAVHAPAPNKPRKFLKSQGPEAVKSFNSAMERYIRSLSEGKTAWESGGVEFLNFYNLTVGMFSYDGTHYGYQANVEKAQVLLNYFDLLWQEIVRAGGLVLETN